MNDERKSNPDKAQQLRARVAQLESQLQSLQPQLERLQLLEEIVQATTNSVLITTAQLAPPGPQIVYANPAFTKMTGYTFEEVIGKTPRILQGPKTDRTVLDRLKDNLTRGEKFQGQTFNYRKDGSEFLLHWHIAPIHAADGELTHFVAIQSDITDDARLAELVENLRASHERFQQLVENIKEVFWITSADGHEMVYISNGYEAIWGRSCQSLYERPLNWLDAILPEDRQRVTKQFAQHAATAGFDIEYRIARPDGTIRWIHDRGFPVRNEEGKVYRIAGIAEDITERKRVESERDHFFNNSLDLLCIANMDGYFIKVNPMFEETLGYAEEELLGAPFMDFIYPEDKEQTVQAMQALAAGKNVVQFENRYLCKDGSLKWLAWSTPAPRRGEKELFAVARDITLQKEVQTALMESEARFRTLVHYAPEAIVMLEADSAKFTDANENALKMFGLSRKKFLSSTPGQLSPPTQPCGRPSAEMAAERIGEALKNKTAVFDWMHRDSRGRDIPCEVRLVRLPGRKRLVRASLIDISERKAAEEAVKQSEARYRELIENANDLIFTIDLQGYCKSFNKAAEELTGYAREEILGRKLLSILAPEYVERVQEAMRLKLATGERTSYEVEILAKNGDRIPLEIHSRMIYENDQPVAIQGIARDIRERKLYEQQLQAAKEAAEAASKAKSEFLANMSHEIRTPMNAVIGLTELVLDSQLSLHQREYLRTVLESANSLMSIINEILDFSKIESGKVEIVPAEFQLRDSIGDTLRSLALRAHDQGLELAWHVHPDVPENLIGDAMRVRQIIVNLVSNAIKFTKAGEVVVDVKCGSVTDSEVDLLFSVADTGIGIPAAKLGMIFEAFEQADSSTTRQFGGTGLGLAISRGLVEMMQGTIWAESQLNVGSTFYFNVKFGLAAARPLELATQLSSIAGLPVLVVDDNATNRLILEEMLKNWEFSVHVVSSAAAALELLANSHEAGTSFALLITDLHMPDVDGFQLCQRIRQDERFADLKIIMLTSGTSESDAGRYEELQIAQHLLKPVKQSELLGTITKTMGVSPLFDQQTTEGFAPAAQMGSLRILLAEDGIANQKLAVGLLTNWGHQVTVANHGQEAVERVMSESFDVILMDVQMPVMDGLEATRRIREYEKKSGVRIPIVAMTAHAMQGDREKCLRAGMDDYVSKPVRRQELYAALQPLISKEPKDTPMDTPKIPQADQAPDDRTIPSSSQIDWEYALGNLDGNRKLLKDVIDAGLEEIPERMTTLRSAIDALNHDSIRREAHTIKGALRLFGLTKAGLAAAAIETLAYEKKHEGLKELFAELQREWESLLPEFNAFE